MEFGWAKTDANKPEKSKISLKPLSMNPITNEKSRDGQSIEY